MRAKLAGAERAVEADGQRAGVAEGGSALDAVEAAARVLEEDPAFNAGRGSVLTADGRVELDAAIMDGADRRAGAVAGMRTTRSPIAAARAAMEHSPHVLLTYDGADGFAREQGLAQVENAWFVTPERQAQLDRVMAAGGKFDTDIKYGTIGAVAVDSQGHVAAATSTGGLTAKRWGRIGDSPLIGAGTYADDRSCAASATGLGEAFIRAVGAHQLAMRIAIGGEGLQQALDAVLADVVALGGNGGLIAVAPSGEAAWGFTTPGMYRALARPGERDVHVFAEAL
jgi:beta-aspartyl-peptidase (threonine type)